MGASPLALLGPEVCAHANVTVPEYPSTAANVTFEIAVPPAETEDGLAAPAVIVNVELGFTTVTLTVASSVKLPDLPVRVTA
jgi:hypothetical protein